MAVTTASKKRMTPKEVLVTAMQGGGRKKNSLSWYDKLPDSDRRWCDEIRSGFYSGQYAHLSAESLSRVVNQELGLSVSACAFRVWLRNRGQ